MPESRRASALVGLIRLRLPHRSGTYYREDSNGELRCAERVELSTPLRVEVYDEQVREVASRVGDGEGKRQTLQHDVEHVPEARIGEIGLIEGRHFVCDIVIVEREEAEVDSFLEKLSPVTHTGEAMLRRPASRVDVRELRDDVALEEVVHEPVPVCKARARYVRQGLLDTKLGYLSGGRLAYVYSTTSRTMSHGTHPGALAPSNP